jgi:predicted esterase
MRRLWMTPLLAALCACGPGEERAAEAARTEAVGLAPLSPPHAAYLPQPTGVCPEFKEGLLTFRPAGIAARNVQIWMSDAARTADGALVFYWHGTGGQPSQAITGLGQTQIDAIKAQGGIVAAPASDPSAGTFPWFYVSSTSRDDDLRVADEVLACAIQKVGIDVSRIHSLGFSAGALQTTQMSYRRSGYIASVATYSGGRASTIPTQDASNKFAAFIFHGGPSDEVVMNFQTASQNYATDLRAKSQFALLCNHGKGHAIPTDARAAVWQFFQAHPHGTVPSPWASTLPSSVPSYCAR